MEKVALVTGGTRGIGQAIAEDLSRDHRVAVTWRGSAPRELSPGIHAIQTDLTQERAALQVVDDVIRHFGRLDVIVNNAGAIDPSPKEHTDLALETQILQVNLLAPKALLSAALPHLGQGASVVNISSINAVLPPRDASIYGASKAALNLWTRAMAKELGPQGVRVNAVAPGAVHNPDAPRPDDLVKLFVQETALGRIAMPEDIAKAVRFLASDQSSFITGEVLTVSGGYRL